MVYSLQEVTPYRFSIYTQSPEIVESIVTRSSANWGYDIFFSKNGRIRSGKFPEFISNNPNTFFVSGSRKELDNFPFYCGEADQNKMKKLLLSLNNLR